MEFRLSETDVYEVVEKCRKSEFCIKVNGDMKTWKYFFVENFSEMMRNGDKIYIRVGHEKRNTLSLQRYSYYCVFGSKKSDKAISFGTYAINMDTCAVRKLPQPFIPTKFVESIDIYCEYDFYIHEKFGLNIYSAIINAEKDGRCFEMFFMKDDNGLLCRIVRN